MGEPKVKNFSSALAFFCAAIFCAGAAIAQTVTIGSPWVRGTVSGQKATGAFMELTSSSDAALVSVTTPIAGSVEVHETRIEDEVMRMHPIRRLSLPAGKTVQLKPGSYHVMLMDLKQALNKGDIVPLTLHIENNDGKLQTLEVRAEVRDLTSRR
jgi:copper(I)-binding protein